MTVPKFSRAHPAILAAPLLGMLTASSLAARAQQNAKAIVSSAVQTELNADRTDHTAYIYRDRDVTPDHDTLYQVIETPGGNLRRKLEDHGKPLSLEERKAEDDRIAKLLADKSLQAKEQRDGARDDEQAEQMLKLLPEAYIWTIAGEQGDLVTLNFRPDPNFTAANMEARVLSAMAGQIVVARGDNRIRTIRGSLVADVKFFLGIGGRLKQGGTFQVERREVAPHHWQVTDSHVKIEGHALFFKSIGSVEDETRSDFKPSPAQNLRQALTLMNQMTR